MKPARLVAILVLTFAAAACRDGPERSGARQQTLPSYALPPSWDETSHEAAIQRADELIENADFEEAIELLRVLASQSSVEDRVRLRYGKALLGAGNPSLALWPLSRVAARSEPESEAAWLHARALLEGGDPRNAIRELDRLIADVPDDPRLLRLRARAHRGALDYDASLADLDAVIALVPDSLADLEARISLLVEVDRVDEARDAVAQLGARLSDIQSPPAARARFCASAALFEFEHEQPDRARERFDACRARFPAEPDVILPWLIFLDGVGETDEATRRLEEIVASTGANRLRLHIALARRYADLGRHADVERVLIEASEAFATPQPLFQLADYRVAWGDLDAAREIANRAIERRFGHAPGSAELPWHELPAEGRFAFGDLLIRTGQFAQVRRLIESFDRALEGDLAEAEAEEVYPLLLRGRLALEEGDPERALELFEESFRFWPSNLGARYLAGRAAMELGRFDRATSLYRDAFRADPTGSDAGLLLARLYQAEGSMLPAAETISTLLGQKLDQPEALHLFAQLTARIGAFENAATAREDLARFHDWQGLALVEAGRETARREGVAEAIARLEREADFDDPAHFEALSEWARLRIQRGERVATLVQLRSLRDAHPEHAEYELVLARAHRELARADGAAAVRVRDASDTSHTSDAALAGYRRAVDLDPALAIGQVELGQWLLERRAFDEAKAAFDAALAIDRSNLDGSIGLADVDRAAGEIARAARREREILVAHPWLGRLAGRLARDAFERGETGDEGLVWARWAARYHGGDRARPAALLGELRLARGEPAEAAAALQIAVQHGTADRSRALFLLARAMAALGDEKAASGALARALEADDFVEPEEAAAARRLAASLEAEPES